MEINNTIPELLLRCEVDGLAPSYIINCKNIESNGKEVIVTSDFHIAAGKGKDGKYEGTENFFADDSFVRFLEHISIKSGEKKSILVINGDFIDFLRIVDYPENSYEIGKWKYLLTCIGIEKDADALGACFNEKEKEFGLKCNDYKSVWKLHKAIYGHIKLFRSLAIWVSKGNELIITKGNHDLEFYFKAVRDYFRYEMANLICEDEKQLIEVLESTILPNITFVDNDLTIDNRIYIAHGHLFDKFSCPQGDALFNKEELNIPFGSFLNRYLINRVELSYPYIDNVRPMENILPLLFREKFYLGLKFFFKHIPFLIRIIPKNYYRYMFSKFAFFALALFIPLVLFITFEWDVISNYLNSNSSSNLLSSTITKFIMGFMTLFGSYVLTKIVAHFQLSEPSSLKQFAKEFIEKNDNYTIVTYGHTHNPEQYKFNKTWFYNTGTWIPILETTSADVRQDKTFTFLYIPNTLENDYSTSPLKRWNDDANRIDELVLIERKDEVQ